MFLLFQHARYLFFSYKIVVHNMNSEIAIRREQFFVFFRLYSSSDCLFVCSRVRLKTLGCGTLLVKSHQCTCAVYDIKQAYPEQLPWFLFHTFSMPFYHKWGIEMGFTFVLLIFLFISDGLGGTKQWTDAMVGGSVKS